MRRKYDGRGKKNKDKKVFIPRNKGRDIRPKKENKREKIRRDR